MKRLLLPAALAAALFTAAPATAADIAANFDYAVLDTPATPDALVVSPQGAPITTTAVVDENTGAFTVDPAAFEFPKYEFSNPIPGTIDVILNAPATGKIDLATGKVELTADFEAQVETSFGTCTVDTGPIVLSTEKDEPHPGQRFPAGVAGFGTGPGAMTVSWESLTPGSEPGCALISPFVDGPGGFWISHGIAPPTEYGVAKLGVSLKPKKKAVKGGRSATFRATVRNTGESPASDVELCAKAPEPGGKACSDLGTIEAGAAKTVPFTLNAPKASKEKRKRYKVKFKATGDDVTPGKATATLIVKKKKPKKK